jgi:hypothetical protein
MTSIKTLPEGITSYLDLQPVAPSSSTLHYTYLTYPILTLHLPCLPCTQLSLPYTSSPALRRPPPCSGRPPPSRPPRGPTPGEPPRRRAH